MNFWYKQLRIGIHKNLKLLYFYSPIKERLEKSQIEASTMPLTWPCKNYLCCSKVGYYLRCHTLQMKGRWESNINFWFWFMYSKKWNCTTLLFPKQNDNVLSLNFHINVSVSVLYIPRIRRLFLLQPNRQTDPGNIHIIVQRYMNVGIGNKAVQYHLLYFVLRVMNGRLRARRQPFIGATLSAGPPVIAVFITITGDQDWPCPPPLSQSLPIAPAS